MTWRVCETTLRLGQVEGFPLGMGVADLVLTRGSTYHLQKRGHLPESSSSSQGISLKGWTVSVSNDAASHLVFLGCMFISSFRLSFILLQKH